MTVFVEANNAEFLQVWVFKKKLSDRTLHDIRNLIQYFKRKEKEKESSSN